MLSEHKCWTSEYSLFFNDLSKVHRETCPSSWLRRKLHEVPVFLKNQHGSIWVNEVAILWWHLPFSEIECRISPKPLKNEKDLGILQVKYIFSGSYSPHPNPPPTPPFRVDLFPPKTDWVCKLLSLPFGTFAVTN